jgi:capsular exopolysaccharide synthesis family protein
LGGLLAGITLCLGLNSLDSSLKTVDRAEQHLRLPALAAVPIGPQASSAATLPLLSEPHGVVAEAFRTLRTSLSLLGPPSERQVFLFTSAVPGEGKSFCSTNFAVSLAQNGARTLLVDADLRLPTIEKIFFKGEVHTGLSNCLAGQCKAADAIQATSTENLWVMTAGNRAPNPAELLARATCPNLLRELAARFDHIVLDTAPITAVSDTLLLVKHVQTVCVVVHAGKTPAKAVLRASAKLAEAGAKPVGFILNRLPKRSGTGYYYYYSAGQYGKGVYGAPKEARS